MEATAPKTSTQCRECQRLERESQRAIDEIYCVVDTKFENIGEKLRKLHKAQDMRDVALRAIYEHGRSHRAQQRCVLDSPPLPRNKVSGSCHPGTNQECSVPVFPSIKTPP
jgi:hypothetical protein